MAVRYLTLAVFLLLVVIAASIGSSFEAGEWYFAMNKPDWTPPAWVFAPIWSVLYVLMALAIWTVWMSGHKSRAGSLTWWLLQLGLNVAWSWLFFGLHRTGWSLLDLTLLLGVVSLCVRAFWASSRVAAMLMLPYLLWLVFAWSLNFGIWMMNGGGIGRWFS